MPHAVDSQPGSSAIESSEQSQQPSAMDTTSHSSTSSPKSQKVELDLNVSQVSETTLGSAMARELTPPSSVTSSQDHGEVEKQSPSEESLENVSAPTVVAGKKRTANGQLKETVDAAAAASASLVCGSAEAPASVAVSQTGNTNLGELSQQLRTKLTYAMMKVQHGWQKHSLDEIESITSQSPRSNISGLAARDFSSLVSPRSALATSMRQNSNTSSSSEQSLRQQPNLSTTSVLNPLSPNQRKALAPPASIVPGNRRKPTPNVHLQINSSSKVSPKSNRPIKTQRTPSQNAAMEADAVETLLFMSASPSNSAHFPSHLSAYSPTSQAFSAQTSPLKTHFSANDRSFPNSAIDYSPRSAYRRAKHEDKAALIDRLLNELDDDESEELDRAVKIMEQHHAAKFRAGPLSSMEHAGRIASAT